MIGRARRSRRVARRFPGLLATLLALAVLVASPAGRPVGGQQPGGPTPPSVTAQAPAPPVFVPGQVVVLVRDGEDLASFLADAGAGGFGVLSTIPELRAAVLSVGEGHEDSTIALLGADPRVEVAERNALLSIMSIPNDPIYKEFQWGLRKIGMESVWDVTTGSPDVIVAVLDTGVDEDHPDLAGNVLDGYDFVHDDPGPWDDSSHGTHVAGVIAALGDNNEGTAGIAWLTKILPVKVLDDKGLGPDAAVSRGIIYAVENRAKIVNLSSGTPYQSRLLDEAVKFAERRGVMVVAAAGNTGDKGNEVIYPAAYPTVMAVGATDEKDNAPPFSQRQSYVAIAAPGVDIPGPAWRDGGNGPYILNTGTSAAAPHVSGLAALLLAIKPDQTPADLRGLIRASADEINPRSRDAFLGAGRINAMRAVSTLRPIPAPTRPSVQPTATSRPGPGTPVVPQAPRIVLPSLRPLPPPEALPEEPSSWYFPEGDTTPAHETWLVVQNPLGDPATARIRFMTQDGLAADQTMVVPPNSRKSLHVNDVVPNALVATRVDSESQVFAEQTMYFGHDAIGGIGTRSPARSWYLAEGSTQPPFDTWILLLNPNTQPTTAKLQFMLESGQLMEVSQPLAPESRVSVDTNDLIPSAGFATAVNADLPIVVGRSMFFGQGGGHGTIAAKTPGKTWFLAEGDSRPGFDTWILLQNPNPNDVANVQVTFIKDDGTTQVAYYALDPSRRLSVFADNVVANGTFGARIDADQPIVVERSIYVANGAGGHTSTAIPIPDTEWYLPEGSTRAPYHETVAILNPNAELTQVDLTFMRSESQQPLTRSFLIQPTSRLSVDVGEWVPDADVSIRATADHPVVVERSTYWDRGASSAPGLTR
jgi:subtilisin family serine protease